MNDKDTKSSAIKSNVDGGYRIVLTNPQTTVTRSTNSGEVVIVNNNEQHQMPTNITLTQQQFTEVPDDNQEQIENSNALTLLQTREQELVYRMHMVTPDLIIERQENLSDGQQRVSSPALSETKSFTVRDYDDKKEYREINQNTLKHYYGDATPYGTIAKAAKSPTYLSPQQQTNTLQEGRISSSTFDQSSNLSNSVYSTLLRTTDSAIHQLPLDGTNVGYVDFLPSTSKQSCGKRDYQSFRNCIKQANVWLKVNKNVEVLKCESVRHRLDHSHTFNPESTTSHDRSYIIALRVWLKKLSFELQHAIEIEYNSFTPNFHNPSNSKIIKPHDCPKFEDLKHTLVRLNQHLNDTPTTGNVLNIETVPLNFSTVLQPYGRLDVDSSYCCLDFQGHWSFFVIRLYYIKTTEIIEQTNQNIIQLGCEDFIPSPLTLPPSRPLFQNFTALTSKLNRWLSKEMCGMVGMETVELPFKMKHMDALKGKLDTSQMCFEPTKSSVYWDTLRFIRVWHIEQTTNEQSALQIDFMGPAVKELAIRTFVPFKLTNEGCCGLQKSLFSTTQNTVARINEWISATGAEVVSVQSDSVEKWRSNGGDLQETLSERTYNREDHVAIITRSALEHRLTVFRVFYRPTAITEAYVEKQKLKPVDSCCCFVGCSVM